MEPLSWKRILATSRLSHRNVVNEPDSAQPDCSESTAISVLEVFDFETFCLKSFTDPFHRLPRTQRAIKCRRALTMIRGKTGISRAHRQTVRFAHDRTRNDLA